MSNGKNVEKTKKDKVDKGAIKASEEKPKQETVREAIREPIKSEKPKQEPPKSGVVIGCNLLNIRKKPNINSEVVLEIPRNTKLTIYEVGSNDEFYKVSVSGNVEGYAMKRYVDIVK